MSRDEHKTDPSFVCCNGESDAQLAILKGSRKNGVLKEKRELSRASTAS